MSLTCDHCQWLVSCQWHDCQFITYLRHNHKICDLPWVRNCCLLVVLNQFVKVCFHRYCTVEGLILYMYCYYCCSSVSLRRLERKDRRGSWSWTLWRTAQKETQTWSPARTFQVCNLEDSDILHRWWPGHRLRVWHSPFRCVSVQWCTIQRVTWTLT